MQTWEYSPAYGIRSYAYLALHSLPLLPLTALTKVRVRTCSPTDGGWGQP